jgi:hypothetical protein
VPLLNPLIAPVADLQNLDFIGCVTVTVTANTVSGGMVLLQVSGEFVYLKGDLNPLIKKKREGGLMMFR